MPRIVRNLICGQYLHIMSQGINREYILKYDNDKEKYLHIVHGVRIGVRCLQRLVDRGAGDDPYAGQPVSNR